MTTHWTHYLPEPTDNLTRAQMQSLEAIRARLLTLELEAQALVAQADRLEHEVAAEMARAHSQKAVGDAKRQWRLDWLDIAEYGAEQASIHNLPQFYYTHVIDHAYPPQSPPSDSNPPPTSTPNA